MAAALRVHPAGLGRAAGFPLAPLKSAGTSPLGVLRYGMLRDPLRGRCRDRERLPLGP